MKKIFFVLTILISLSATAQNKHHKIVFDLVSSDTADYGGVLRQFNNILKIDSGAELEVVCHGPAVYMLVKDTTPVEDRVKEIKSRANVSFKVCANSMKKLKVDKSQIISSAEIVPVAMLELADRQMDGWSYIRAGH